VTAPADTSIREAAEYPNSFIPLGRGDERVQTDRYTLCLSIGATVQRQRFAVEEIDEVLAEVRELLRARGRTGTQWEVGSQAADLVGPLLERGLVRDADPVAIALALEREPPAAPADFEVRAASTLEEYLQAAVVQAEAFGASPEEAATHREGLKRRWTDSPFVMHAVWSGGEIIGAGACSLTPVGLALFGGAVLPRWRGRGAYRALIAERWRYAATVGRQALVTQAGSMSRPILEGLGFRAVGRVEMLRDELVEA
jgi:GNAT superfamily N-acetyltransferase